MFLRDLAYALAQPLLADVADADNGDVDGPGEERHREVRLPLVQRLEVEEGDCGYPLA